MNEQIPYRRFMILDDQYKQAIKEKEEKEKNLKKVRPTTAVSKK